MEKFTLELHMTPSAEREQMKIHLDTVPSLGLCFVHQVVTSSCTMQALEKKT